MAMTKRGAKRRGETKRGCVSNLERVAELCVRLQSVLIWPLRGEHGFLTGMKESIHSTCIDLLIWDFFLLPSSYWLKMPFKCFLCPIALLILNYKIPVVFL